MCGGFEQLTMLTCIHQQFHLLIIVYETLLTNSHQLWEGSRLAIVQHVDSDDDEMSAKKRHVGPDLKVSLNQMCHLQL